MIRYFNRTSLSKRWFLIGRWHILCKTKRMSRRKRFTCIQLTQIQKIIWSVLVFSLFVLSPVSSETQNEIKAWTFLWLLLFEIFLKAWGRRNGEQVSKLFNISFKFLFKMQDNYFCRWYVILFVVNFCLSTFIACSSSFSW